jgi:hypothetical protein
VFVQRALPPFSGAFAITIVCREIIHRWITGMGRMNRCSEWVTKIGAVSLSTRGRIAWWFDNVGEGGVGGGLRVFGSTDGGRLSFFQHHPSH